MIKAELPIVLVMKKIIQSSVSSNFLSNLNISRIGIVIFFWYAIKTDSIKPSSPPSSRYKPGFDIFALLQI